MKLPILLLSAGALCALATTGAIADETDFSTPVHDIIVTSNIPAINVSVRNVSQSQWAHERDLRMISADPVIEVSGQVWCKNALGTQAYAVRAQVIIANALVHGHELIALASSGASAPQTFPGNDALENFELEIDYDIPDSWDSSSLITFGMNPVKIVEERLETFVGNGAGTPADFLRVDDVFETTITVSVAGWCRWDEFVPGREYAGVRRIQVPVHIFYNGDEDIADRATTVNTAGTVQAQPENRARATTSARGAQTSPPARSTPPARSRPARAERPRPQ